MEEKEYNKEKTPINTREPLQSLPFKINNQNIKISEVDTSNPKISRPFFYISVFVFIIIICPIVNGLFLPKTTGFNSSLLVVYKTYFYELIFSILAIIFYEVYRKIIKNK